MKQSETSLPQDINIYIYIYTYTFYHKAQDIEQWGETPGSWDTVCGRDRSIMNGHEWVWLHMNICGCIWMDMNEYE